MADGTPRFGTALLALNTNRPPDPDRGRDVVHFELVLPPAIEAQVDLWERGARDAVSPREAAGLLWTSPVAAFLDGRRDAWRDVPGVALLLPGLEQLAHTELGAWPKDQKELRQLVAAEAPGNPTPAALVKTLDGDGTVDLLNDLVLIFKYAAVGQARPVRTVAELYRLARTLTATGVVPATRGEVIAWLTAPLVVPSALSEPSGPRGAHAPPARGGRGRPPRPRPLPPIDVTSPRALEAIRALERQLDDIERAGERAELETALSEAGVRDPKVLAALTRLLPGRRLDLPAGATEPAAPRTERQMATRRRHKVVKTYIAGVPVVIDTTEARARTARLRSETATRLAEALPARIRERVEHLGLVLEELTLWPDLLDAVAAVPSFLEPVGRSDLLLVRQTTIGYRRAELAYIENILIGETRAREHTMRVLTREELIESIERETEETRDLQVTDRAALSKEVNEVVKEDLRAQGNVEVTSRGPTQIVASASVSFERSTEEAAKSAEEYSRETIERAVKRTLERVRREVRSLLEQETLEVNRHSFERDDTAPDHVSGLYQYLERVSRAKIFWYGERELYDLLVPEPAALIWHLAISRQEVQIPLNAPDEELFDSLTIDNIADRRDEAIRAFRVTDFPPVPEEERELSMSFAGTGKGDEAKYSTNKELQVPDGYVVRRASFVVSAEVEDEDDLPNGGIAIGPDVRLWQAPISGNQGTAREDFLFSPALPGPTVGVAINADNFTSLAGGVTLNLELTDEARRAWALDAYGRVAERFEQLRREYEQAVIQATASRPEDEITLPEGSRQSLAQLVRAELQRTAIDIMRNVAVDFDLITDHWFADSDGTLVSQPTADLPALHAAEPEVRFLQQAFEWEHLSWILYPYFWGRRTEWRRTVVQMHPDPDFAAFLNAGAARLQIPVRPGFEDLVKHFMETGEVYEGGELPKMGDPGYVAFIDEQLTSLGAPGDEIPWPPDAPREWDVVAPTSLVLVRSTAEKPLPTWDPKTGDET
jgi:hypothetical protein